MSWILWTRSMSSCTQNIDLSFLCFRSASKSSCEDRCLVGYDASLPCQCNNQCETYGNCCSDFYSAGCPAIHCEYPYLPPPTFYIYKSWSMAYDVCKWSSVFMDSNHCKLQSLHRAFHIFYLILYFSSTFPLFSYFEKDITMTIVLHCFGATFQRFITPAIKCHAVIYSVQWKAPWGMGYSTFNIKFPVPICRCKDIILYLKNVAGGTTMTLSEFAEDLWDADSNRISSSRYTYNRGEYISNTGDKVDRTSGE